MIQGYCIFDLEIIKGIPPKNPADRVPGIEYCDGWKDFKDMGISVMGSNEMLLDGERVVASEACCFEWSQDRDRDRETICLLKKEGYKFGGFNSRKFDDLLLQANGVALTSDFDILEMVLEAAGCSEIEYWNLEPRRSYSLDAITRANGLVKTGEGSLAPVWWQQGEKQRVIDYCKNDAEIEAEVFQLLLNGKLKDPNTGELLHYPVSKLLN